MKRLAGFGVVVWVAAGGTSSFAQSEVRLGASLDNLGTRGEVALRLPGTSTWRAEFRLRGGAVSDGWVGGQAVQDALELGGDIGISGILGRRGPVAMRFGGYVGARSILADEETPDGEDTSIELLLGFDMGVEIAASESLIVFVGTRVPAALALSPEVEVALLGNTVIYAGADLALDERLVLSIEATTGGLFGFGGDGAKHLVGGSVSVGYPFGRGAEPVDSDPAEGVFVALEWRILRLAGHTSHGPGFRAGVHFDLDEIVDLKLGVAGYARPGPINGQTFALDLGAETYKGQQTLSLRGDGGFVGLLIAPVFALGSWLQLELPILVGQGAYGFYFTDEDRETPDGRRVSDWENELQDGRDASVGIVVEPGLNLLFTPESLPWLRPYVGVSYSLNLGYDAFLEDSYDGLTVVFGTELGIF